jgi:endonuclease/exonuclease/phosphatase family metal-dependent hydrolase
MTLKILTLNLWNTSGPWDARRPRVREWVDKLEPDLIGFQEVLRAPDGDGIDMAREILEGAGFHIEHGANARQGGIHFGNAVASRWPIVDRDVAELPNGDRPEGRCAVSVTVDAPFGEVSFTSTHLNWKLHDGHSREQQVVALADVVLKRRPRGGFPPIVVGDFNAVPDSAEIRYMTGLQLRRVGGGRRRGTRLHLVEPQRVRIDRARTGPPDRLHLRRLSEAHGGGTRDRQDRALPRRVRRRGRGRLAVRSLRAVCRAAHRAVATSRVDDELSA